MLRHLVIIAHLVQIFKCVATYSDIEFICGNHSFYHYRYTNVSYHHGECAIWDHDHHTFHWVDVLSQDVHAFNIATQDHRMRHIDLGEVNLALPIKNSRRLLVGVRSSLYILDWDKAGSEGLRLIASVDQGLPDNVINDGKADASGRLWIGTKGPQSGKDVTPDMASLYSLEKTLLQPDVRLRPVSISNGLDWSLDNRLMYYVDSAQRTVDVFDFNITTAHLSNRRVVLDLNDYKYHKDVLPDGLAIDRDGLLWVALNFGGVVVRVDPKAKRIVHTIQFPVKQVTCPAWGGPKMETLFVTSSRRGMAPREVSNQPLAGAIFVLNDLGTGGVASYKFDFPDADHY